MLITDPCSRKRYQWSGALIILLALPFSPGLAIYRPWGDRAASFWRVRVIDHFYTENFSVDFFWFIRRTGPKSVNGIAIVKSLNISIYPGITCSRYAGCHVVPIRKRHSVLGNSKGKLDARNRLGRA